MVPSRVWQRRTVFTALAQRYFKAARIGLAPLAVFWNAENMHLPAGLCGLEFADSLQSTLAPFGILTKFTVTQLQSRTPPLGHTSAGLE